MGKQKTLVFFGAHPDDEAFGVGGTLAQYAAAGVKVYYACATRGEAGDVAPEHIKGYDTIGDMRWAELKCSAQVLGLAGIIHLGYRDSGMPNSRANKHPKALVAALPEQVVGCVVQVIRELKPEVVITFDPIGGYRHPDHIAINNATVKAFYVAGDPKQYPEAGPAFQPQKLYFSVFSRRFLKVAVKLLPLFGQDPHRLGSNKDIDVTSLAEIEFPIHATISLTKQAIETRGRAVICYVSQRPRRATLFRIIERLPGQRDLYMRAYPPPDTRRREGDLFEGVQ
ncbi:MAG: PIG-L deacetylase family protein [Dehalococcoidales bacterium]|jgi:N-acetyl-1-D-myo-inositol-2-amino-2-deoxy-alpha-D-glucopyranoside deacetylase/mycothiol S-conjugate amidase|nr:PIG-L deacetylase family protein [Dehalococcoidales bacterium]|tara:strand:+ start:281 stop:1129 length:849 start_codon:yes stop_codon:yes gene_type:complete